MAEKIEAEETRGRPAYSPTIESRQRVQEMKFCGESDNVIARALGIAPETLRKHFGEELADGHAQRRSEIIGLLFTSARNGNVSAIKRLDEIGRAAGASEAIDRRGRTPEPKLGKKEQRQLAAEGVSGKFATPAAPKLALVK